MIAQAVSESRNVAVSQGAAPAAGDEEQPDTAIEEIVVTGSQIRGAGAAGADVITLDRDYIELSGFATTQEVLRSIPQNSDVGPSEGTSAANFASGSNRGFSSSVNLRGLGSESTLSLVNGRRTAPGGAVGGFADLNFVPISAIERVEVLADGPSAIYGSDAVAGVVNVIPRDDYDDAETSVLYAPGTSDINEIQFGQSFGRSWETGNVFFTYEYYDRGRLQSADRTYERDSDLTRFGGSDSSTRFNNPGNINRYTAADGTVVNVQLAIPTGQDGTALTPNDLLPGVTRLQNIRETSWILPSQERQSALLMLSQELSRVPAPADRPSDRYRIIAQAVDEIRNVPSSQGDPRAAVEETIVTANSIRGVRTVGTDVIALDRKYKELGDMASTQEISQTVTRSFVGDTNKCGSEGCIDNPGFSSSAYLHGLRAESALSRNDRRWASIGLWLQLLLQSMASHPAVLLVILLFGTIVYSFLWLSFICNALVKQLLRTNDLLIAQNKRILGWNCGCCHHH